ncbi:lipid droplet-associated hydrolase isoform X3 [Brienomyrus brachyistius]|nr:lipid droplet-associated hydrolase isoform X3 [Brienomyrus brachyistius]XP_048831195.1 lipid droplet-associated hydrolase isoform X3 [Brienomyrus brachyistius]
MGSLGEDGGGQVCDGVLEHLYCCGAATEVLKFGQRELGPLEGRHGSPPLLFLIIPGNPGLVGFYRPFMKTLWQSFQGLHPVWAVSHAGHCVPPDSMDMTEDGPLLETHDVFGLRGQIEHKMAFLKRHVPRDTKLVLIGHSIGCYIILEMMKRDPQMQVLKALLLFPTIERMAASPQGRLMTPVLCRLRFITYLPIFLLSLLPLSLQAAIVKVVLSGLPSLDRTAAAATLSLFNVDCVGESTSGCPHPAPHTLPLYPRPSNPVPYAPHPTPYVLLSPLHSPILYLHPTLYPTPSHPVPYTLPSTLHTVK